MKTKKENLVLLIGMIIVLGTHLVSCEKVPTPPVVEPELMPKLELSVTPQGEIPYGEVATLKGTLQPPNCIWTHRVHGDKHGD